MSGSRRISNQQSFGVLMKAAIKGGSERVREEDRKGKTRAYSFIFDLLTRAADQNPARVAQPLSNHEPTRLLIHFSSFSSF